MINRIFLDNSEYYIFAPDDEIITIYYYENENIFVDENGFTISNIFDFITPGDLYLFRSKFGRSIFPYRYGDNVICEIISIDVTLEDDFNPDKETRYI